jgi:hypothetical protein
MSSQRQYASCGSASHSDLVVAVAQKSIGDEGSVVVLELSLLTGAVLSLLLSELAPLVPDVELLELVASVIDIGASPGSAAHAIATAERKPKPNNRYERSTMTAMMQNGRPPVDRGSACPGIHRPSD